MLQLCEIKTCLISGFNKTNHQLIFQDGTDFMKRTVKTSQKNTFNQLITTSITRNFFISNL